MQEFKYAHLADLHLGSWRDPKMREISSQTFKKAIDECINQKVDFILFAGDIFNNALPAIDIVNFLAKTLQTLKEHKIPLYVIPGSHDFSPTNRSMIDVLESAGLLINVCKGKVNQETKLLELNYTIDPKTNAKITGILGRRGMLDTVYYENLNRERLEQEQGYKIFMFHTTLTELKPKHLEIIDSQPASFLPKNQNYYAGGHIHHKSIVNPKGYGPMTYTGALFPNNFAELEKYSHGGFYIISVSNNYSKTNNNDKQTIEFIPIKIKEHTHTSINAKGKTPKQVQEEIVNHFLTKHMQTKLSDQIITIRVEGKLLSGKATDLDWQEIMNQLNQEINPYNILKNDTKLQGEEYEEILLAQGSMQSQENIEESLIKEHLGQFQTFDTQTELNLIKDLLSTLNTSKQEGEKNTDFQTRIKQHTDILLAKTIDTKTPQNNQ